MSETGRILIEKLDIYAYHGFFSEEERLGQRFVLDLVLDADLRSPDAHNVFDVPQGAGISDYVSDLGDTPLESLVRPTSVPGVRIRGATSATLWRVGGLLRRLDRRSDRSRGL